MSSEPIDAVPDRFTEYRVNCLLMLVGGNPLPNAVCAPLLTRRGARLVLLHSRETEPIAKRIVQSLDPALEIRSELALVDVSDRVSITTRIREALQSEQGTIGLHYTGGTKAMSVHAFRAVESFAQKQRRRAVFSYLDPRKLDLMIDLFQDDHFPANPERVPIGDTPFSLKKMLALHEWEIRPGTPLHTQRFLPKTTQAITEVNAGSQFGKWLDWKNDVIKRTKEIRGEGYRKEVVWNKVAVPLPPYPELASVREALIAELQITGEILDLETARRSQSVSLEFFGEYIEAKWLEVLSLHALLDHRERCGLRDISMSLKPRLKANPGVHFELDCVALRGYQLFAISCTTDWDQVAREHLFEVFVRARQIGGDEARVALVCTTHNPDLLREKIRRDLDLEARVRVFGRNDLPVLSDRFADWIEEASRGGNPR